MTINLKVLDLSHHNCGPSGDPNDPIDFEAIAAYGVKGIIHKASQGTGVVDHKYAERRTAAVAAGLLWGAYHFATGDDVDAQVKHFLDCAQPDASTLTALDHEPNGGNELDLAGARSFMESLRDQNSGKNPVIYSGNLIKEQMAKDDSQNDFFGSFRLWLCQYGPNAVLPPAWDRYWLWQFAGDGTNSHGIVVPGIFAGSKVDMNTWDGTDEDLAAQWAT
jgi:lysozyme